jgi:hypothetical protein
MTVNTVPNQSNIVYTTIGAAGSTTYTPAIGAIGSPNSYLISGGGGGGGNNGSAGYLSNSGSLSWGTTGSPSVSITGSQLQITPVDKGDAIIKTNHNEINLDKLYKTVMMIADKMMIIADDPYFTEKYPTLKDAYEQYQTLLELYKQGEKSGD